LSGAAIGGCVAVLVRAICILAYAEKADGLTAIPR
jgi:hypothetical protein